MQTEMLATMDHTPVEILTDDNPLLKEVSQPITEFNDDLVQLVVTMMASMTKRRGIGLSAVQIGQLKRVIIAVDQDKKQIVVMINPEFIRKGNRDTVEREGCLSISPSKWRNVSRPAKCEVRYQDVAGGFFTANLSGRLSRIVQHEMDHLDGILITDKPYVKGM